MKALVVGGFAAKTRGSWAKALREHCGIEVAHVYGADNDFKGLPSTLPSDVGLVLAVVGTCSHKASNRAKALAVAAGARWEPVSKDTTRAVQWLRQKGFTSAPQPVSTVEVHMGEPTWLVEGMQQETTPEVEQEVKVEAQTKTEFADWLDFSQVRELLPDLHPATFYGLTRKLVKRDEVREPRTRIDATGRTVTTNMLLWSLAEVEEVEALAKSRGLLKPKVKPEPAPEPPKSNAIMGTPFRPLSEAPKWRFVPAESEPLKPVSEAPPLYKLVASEQYSAPAVHASPEAVSVLRDYHAEMATLMDEYAHKKTRDLRGMLDKVVAERDALRAQLDKIKLALGLDK